MGHPTHAIAHLERQAVEADRMAAKSPFTSDRLRFKEMAARYRLEAAKLKF